MNVFLDRARLEQIDWREGRPVWMTLAPLRYQSAALGRVLVVPAEFITDLASVPRMMLAWWIAGGRGVRSSILHDFAYQFGHWGDAESGDRIVVDKPAVDAEFFTSLVADAISGASPLIARLMYFGVRWGGRGRWADTARAKGLNPEWTAAGWQAG